MKYLISGIQQIGVGVKDADQAWKWYRRYFGVDVPVFKERAQAGLMLPYTGGAPRSRYAILAMNMQGGGGFEIWQYTCREPQPSAFDVQLGDYGIFASKIKSPDVQRTYEFYQAEGVKCLSKVHQVGGMPANFFALDPYGNIFQVVEASDWFQNRQQSTGGVYGAVIGVSDIDAALGLYRDVLGYDEVVSDESGVFEGLADVPGGTHPMRRLLLRHSAEREGAFAPLLGRSELELVQLTGGRQAQKIYGNRMWGDLGFIHLCFDVCGMDELRERCAQQGFPFTVDSSNSFDMGEAAGRFSYVEDPDGTLIEFVETHKVPIMKKLGWYLNLQRRVPSKPLPRWLIKAMSFSRVKD